LAIFWFLPVLYVFWSSDYSRFVSLVAGQSTIYLKSARKQYKAGVAVLRHRMLRSGGSMYVKQHREGDRVLAYKRT
jgi:hypothetical protein